MGKKKTKKQKLIVQISIITVIMFVVTLVFTSISDYLITRNSYLSSKNEMIDRDLKTTIRIYQTTELTVLIL